MRTNMSLHIALLFAGLGISLSTIGAVPANAQNQNMEVIHHPHYDKNVFMPFVPAIKIKSGRFLACRHDSTAGLSRPSAPRDEIQEYMVNDLEAQTRAAMDGIKQTLDARTPPSKTWCISSCSGRGRGWATSAGDAMINPYFAPFNHKPTSTNVAVLELGRARAAHRNPDGCGRRLADGIRLQPARHRQSSPSPTKLRLAGVWSFQRCRKRASPQPGVGRTGMKVRA